MRPSQHRARLRSRAGALVPIALLACGVLMLAACGGSDSPESDSGETTTSPAMTTPATTSDTGVEPPRPAPAETERQDPDTPTQSPITVQEAERIALAWVGEGRVTDSEPEDDHGAAWEIEVTRPDGSEVDVYVAADGTVVFGRTDKP